MTLVMVRYTSSLDGIMPHMLDGFFDGWPDRPSPETHLRILRASHHVVLAIDDEAQRVVGFINAISDGVHAAFIPLLEVLPNSRGRGIGSELVNRMLTELHGFYSIDLACDPDVQPFYERLGMKPISGMMIRNMSRQGRGVE